MCVDSFNSTNHEYDAVLSDFCAYNPNGLNVKKHYYYLNAPITFVCNIALFKKNSVVLAQEYDAHENDELIPFQLIGLKSDHEASEEQKHPVWVDFAESVIKRFDMSCCQFAIESPYEPNLVRALSDENLSLFYDMQFTYDMRKFTTVRVFQKRVSKYMNRGYMFVGAMLGCHILSFESARIRDIRDYWASRMHDLLYDCEGKPQLSLNTSSDSISNEDELCDVDAHNSANNNNVEDSSANNSVSIYIFIYSNIANTTLY